MTKEERAVLNDAVNKYGIINQTLMLAEECSEVVKASTKLARSVKPAFTLVDDLVEEMADVLVMFEQMCIYYGISQEEIESVMRQKITRLRNRLNN